MELVLIKKHGKLGLFKDISIYTMYVRNDLDLFKKRSLVNEKKTARINKKPRQNVYNYHFSKGYLQVDLPLQSKLSSTRSKHGYPRGATVQFTQHA